MEKVKITIEQEEALKFILKLWEGKSLIEIYEIFLGDREHQPYFSKELVALNEISTQDFFFILHGWYEVEKPKFKVGDWVFDTDLEIYRKVADEKGLGIRYVYVDATNEFPYFEKVTEQWKIVLLEAGRGKPELKKGDKYTTEEGNDCTVLTGTAPYHYERLKFVKYFYPVESRIEVK